MACSNGTGGRGGGSDLFMEYDSVISAAGGIDKIVDTVLQGRVDGMDSCGSCGSPELNAALVDFAHAWSGGLLALTEAQQGTAEHLRRLADDFLHMDTDIAAALRAAEKDLGI